MQKFYQDPFSIENNCWLNHIFNIFREISIEQGMLELGEEVLANFQQGTRFPKVHQGFQSSNFSPPIFSTYAAFHLKT